VEDDTVAWHENDGRGNFSKHIVDNAAAGAYGVFDIDMDFDGDIDLLSASRDAFEVALHTHIRAHQATVTSGGTLTIDSYLLLTVDGDDGPAELTYTISQAPAYGDLRLDSSPLSSGATFTQQDVNDGRLSYLHSGANQLSDEFWFTVADGGENGVQPASGVFHVQIDG
jgi:hypothetical protein